MSNEPKTPREFSNFDDVPGNNGWDGMSILDEPRYTRQPEDDEPNEDYPIEPENTFVVPNTGSFACVNSNKPDFDTLLGGGRIS